MSNAADMLVRARQCRQAGRLAEARALCEQVLHADQSNVDARYLLALVCHGLGQVNDAIAHLQQVVRLDPHHASAHNNLGSLLERQGDLQAAADCYRRALEIEPAAPVILANLGGVLERLGDLPTAGECFQRAIDLKPDFVAAINRLGTVLDRLGNPEAAMNRFRQAAALDPTCAEAHYNLGIVLARQQNLDAGLQCFRRAMELKPDYAEAHNNAGFILDRLGQLDAAEACFRRALEIAPGYPEAHNNLGIALKRRRNTRAADCFRRAIEIKPDYSEAHFNLASVLLLEGHFAQGWAEYEWRPRDCREAFDAASRWQGQAMPGGTILLRCEQGLGDIIQFVRYAQLVKQRAGTVIVECPRVLAGLLASCPGVDKVVPIGGSPPQFDAQIPLLSLPGLFGTTLATIPANVPYLSAPADGATFWQRELVPGDKLKVGIAWQGNPANAADHERSFPLSLFRGVVGTPGVQCYSLQFGAGREQLADFADRGLIVDLGDRLGEFDNTAAIVRNLDLVITTDSATAHLAGALALPVWVALPYVPDWRWLLDRPDSPWYPTMRLFRQGAPGDWASVFKEIESELVKVALPA